MKLKRLTLLIPVTLLIFTVSPLLADQAAQVVGDWCFYQQSGFGETVPEKINLSFKKDGTYVWHEPPVFTQKGTWKLEDGNLQISDVGSHEVLKITDTDMELKRYSTMKHKRGTCDGLIAAGVTEIPGFSSQEIVAFHNAASMGDTKTIQDYLKKGIDINITDMTRGDTALIKSASFCQTDAAKLLIDSGADTTVVNERGKKAADLATSSSFHEGCDSIVQLLK